MKALVEIELGNDAFKGSGDELARVIRNIAQDVEDYNLHDEGAQILIKDINGNSVGEFKIVDTPPRG